MEKQEDSLREGEVFKVLVNRWYQILNTLILSQSISIQELCQKTGFSRHNIKTGIQMLNDQLKGIARIQADLNNYQIVILNQNKFDQIMDGSLKGQSDFNSSTKRIAYVIKSLLEKDYVLIDDLAERTDVSRGTMNKDLRGLRSLLKEYGINLQGTPNKGLQLQGEEFDLRLLMIQHVIDYFPEQFELSDEIEQTLINLCNDLHIEKANYSLLRKSLLVSMHRIKHNAAIQSAIHYYYNRIIDESRLEHFFYEVETEFAFSLSQYEREFIQFPIYINHFSQIEITELDEQRLANIFNQMMAEIQKEYYVEIDQSRLFQELKYHLMMMMNRLLFHIQTTDIFIDEIVNSYPFAYKMAKVALEALGNIVGRVPPETEISYLAIYFELFLQKNLQISKRHVAIVSSASVGIRTLIKQQVRDIIGSDAMIVHFTEEEARRANFDEYYVVFSTIPLEHNVKHTVVIRVTNLFSGNFLKSEWMKLSKSSSVNFSNQLFYFRIINDSLTYKQILEQMVQQLALNGLVDPDFEQRMAEREMLTNSFYQNGVAFPHTVNLNSDKIIVSVATSQEPISLGNEKIQVIILLAIPEAMSDEVETELLALYDFIFRIMGKSLIKQKLLQIKNEQELSRYFQLGGVF
ncbi:MULTISPECIES: PTS sugar transporter subunit IIA [unclassified Enterococcus]|uniref:BglG family transcription antiterminator n=1 Tax=unclassified Enterococcus TaxID=2608891 RepID=UPI0032DE56C4